MGEAKRRGTFAERKKNAIAAGRIKRPKLSIRRLKGESLPLLFELGCVEALLTLRSLTSR